MLNPLKKFWLLPVIVIALVACNPGNKEKPNNPEADEVGATTPPSAEPSAAAAENTKQVPGVPMAISEDQFAEKVFNFRKNGPWKYQGDKPCIIDFYADWCGPCRMIAPYMRDFAKTYDKQIYVYKINTDYAEDLSMFFQINAIPAVMMCPMKGDYKMLVGAKSKENYDELIRSFLLNKKS